MVGSFLKKTINGVETNIYPYTAAEYVQYQNTSISEYLEKKMVTMSTGTRSHWAKPENAGCIPKTGELIMYFDGETAMQNGKPINVPWLKIGDGVNNVASLPFVGVDALSQHINNAEIHVSSTDRETWNNKVMIDVDANSESLIISI